MIQTLLIALSLSMDAFAVSVSSAACSKNLSHFHMIRAALSFGFFQFLMPLLGALLGATFSSLINGYDHWIAFFLLALVGGKMLHEVWEEWKESPDSCACPTGEEAKKRDISSKRIVFVLSIATSIDALAIGMSYAVINQSVLFPSIVIGLVTFAVCVAGFFGGRKIGCVFGRWAQLTGAFVLIGIGVRILVTHIGAGI